MKGFKSIRENMIKLESLLEYYDELDNKDDDKSQFKKRYVEDKILTLCIENKKKLDKMEADL